MRRLLEAPSKRPYGNPPAGEQLAFFLVTDFDGLALPIFSCASRAYSRHLLFRFSISSGHFVCCLILFLGNGDIEDDLESAFNDARRKP